MIRLTHRLWDSSGSDPNFALILLTAREIGATVLSRNIADMDRLTQMRPDAKVLLYRV